MSEAQCGYRAESCSDIGRMVNGKWQCQRHIDMDELQRLRDERDRLVKFAKSVGHPQWCKGFMTRDAELCSCGWYVIFPAALTPAGGG